MGSNLAAIAISVAVLLAAAVIVMAAVSSAGFFGLGAPRSDTPLEDSPPPTPVQQEAPAGR